MSFKDFARRVGAVFSTTPPYKEVDDSVIGSRIAYRIGNRHSACSCGQRHPDKGYVTAEDIEELRIKVQEYDYRDPKDW